MPRKQAITGSSRATTTERVLAAALKVFAEHGLAATTRQISQAAKVNEVTLFRQFESKEKLLAAAVREMVRLQWQALDSVDLEDFDLRRDLMRIAQAYDATTTRHMGFIRTMLAQPAAPKMTDQMTREVLQPLRDKFLAYLGEARRRGFIRNVALDPAVDAFTGMVFSGALRRDIRKQAYPAGAYLEACVEIFLEGIGNK